MDDNQWFPKGENLDKQCMFYYSVYVHAMHTKALTENQSTVLASSFLDPLHNIHQQTGSKYQ